MESVLDETIVASLLMVKREGFQARLVRLFESNTGDLLKDIEEALRTHNQKLLETSAHSLSSAASSVGAQRVSGLAQQLEEIGRSGAWSLSDGRLVNLRDEICHAVEALELLFLGSGHRKLEVGV